MMEDAVIAEESVAINVANVMIVVNANIAAMIVKIVVNASIAAMIVRIAANVNIVVINQSKNKEIIFL